MNIKIKKKIDWEGTEFSLFFACITYFFVQNL